VRIPFFRVKGCLEVDALKSKAKCAHKDIAEVRGELLHSKRMQFMVFKLV
jgi:hypothetical protein